MTSSRRLLSGKINEVEIRKAKSGDEYELVKLFKLLYTESDFMLMEPGEDELSVEQQANLISECSQSPDLYLTAGRGMFHLCIIPPIYSTILSRTPVGP